MSSDSLSNPVGWAKDCGIVARILIVEDEQTDLAIIKRLVEQLGHEVHVASDGEEAFRKYLRQDFEVVITDLEMPRVGGLEFIESLLALYAQAKIIAVSAKGPDQLHAARRAGAAALISKPVSPEAVGKALAEVGFGDDDSSVRGGTAITRPFWEILQEATKRVEAAGEKSEKVTRSYLEIVREQVQILLNQIEAIESRRPEYVQEMIPEGLREDCIELVERSCEVQLAFTETVEARNTLNASSVKMMKDYHELHGDHGEA